MFSVDHTIDKSIVFCCSSDCRSSFGACDQKEFEYQNSQIKCDALASYWFLYGMGGALEAKNITTMKH